MGTLPYLIFAVVRDTGAKWPSSEAHLESTR